MRVICPCRCLNPGPALVSSGVDTLPGRRYNTVSLLTRLDAGQGRGQASGPAAAVRCCQWPLELTDGSLSSLNSLAAELLQRLSFVNATAADRTSRFPCGMAPG